MKSISRPVKTLLSRPALGCLAVFCVLPLLAAKKPVTIADMLSQQRSFAPSPVWRPDGAAFAYRDHGKVFLYDAPTGKAKEWFDLTALEESTKKASAPGSHSTGRTGASPKRRCSGFPMVRTCWSRPAASCLSCIRTARATGLRSAAVEAEDPKLSPDGSSILYRRDFNLYVLTISDGKTTQLTSDGTPTLMNGKLDWVYPEELDLGNRLLVVARFEVRRLFPVQRQQGIRVSASGPAG